MTDSGLPSLVLTKARFGHPTRDIESDVTVGTSSVNLVGNNPNRIQLEIYNNGQSTVYVSRNRNVAVNTGTPIGPNGGSLVRLIAEDGMSTGNEVWGISGATGNAVHIVENIVQAG